MEQLKELSNNLFFLSESGSRFEVLHYPTPSNNDNLYPKLRQWSGIPTDARIEEEELEHFFRNHTNEDAEDKKVAQRFRELQSFLKQNLQGMKVYKLGARRITAVILGRSAAGDYVGLRTMVIET